MFAINYRDPRPVYEQIVDGMRKMIIAGVFAPDERLPSVRELSAQLAINPNTIQKAYRELEISGYLYSVPGKGNYAGTRQEIDTGRRDALLKTLADTVQELRWLGFSDADLAAYLRQQEGVKTDD